MTLGEIIKSYRTMKGMSMDGFAEKSGMSKAYISLLEKNKHPKTGKPIAPSIQSIKMAADAMGMDFNQLFGMIDSDVEIGSEISLSEREKAHIHKYRIIDDHGKDLVDLILDKEYDRCSADADSVWLNAAHQRTDTELSGTSHDDDIMDDDSGWN